MKSNPDPGRWRRINARLVQLGVLLLVGTVLVSLVLGFLAAIVGSSLTRLGAGPGGLWGAPNFVFTFVLLISVPSLLFGMIDVLRGRPGGFGLISVFLAPIALAAFFFFAPHAIDPCYNGLWDPRSSFGSIPRCEPYDREYNIAQRFHLLLHAVPTIVPVALWWVFTKRLDVVHGPRGKSA
jgi:hypothetical protein